MTNKKYTPTPLMVSLRWKEPLDLTGERFRVLEEISQGLLPLAKKSKSTWRTCCLIFGDACLLALDPNETLETIWSKTRLATRVRILDLMEEAESC